MQAVFTAGMTVMSWRIYVSSLLEIFCMCYLIRCCRWHIIDNMFAFYVFATMDRIPVRDIKLKIVSRVGSYGKPGGLLYDCCSDAIPHKYLCDCLSLSYNTIQCTLCNFDDDILTRFRTSPWTRWTRTLRTEMSLIILSSEWKRVSFGELRKLEGRGIYGGATNQHLAGSTRLRGPHSGDSVSLLCLVLQSDLTYSFITTLLLTSYRSVQRAPLSRCFEGAL